MRFKRGQVTLFIILSLIIVVGVLIFFFFIRPNIGVIKSGKINLDYCVETAVKNEVIVLSKTTGIKNSNLTVDYYNEKIPYVCYAENNLELCTVQEPFLLYTFTQSLKSAIKDDVEKCYTDSLEQLKIQGYNITSGKLTYDVQVNPSKIIVNINAPTTFNADSSSKISKIPVEITSDAYQMYMIASTILEWEANYGDIETSTLNYYYPDFSVEKIRIDGGIKIYKITNKKDIEIKFASRSLVWPAGYGALS